MYDRTTESLWSQTLGQAVVGDYVGTKLSIIDSNVISWSELETHHLDAMVLSTDTGRPRNYSSSSPYGSYDTNERLYFPVANMEDARLPLKEMLYVTNIADGVSIAFVLAELRNQLSGRLLVDDDEYIAYYEDAEYRII